MDSFRKILRHFRLIFTCNKPKESLSYISLVKATQKLKFPSYPSLLMFRIFLGLILILCTITGIYGQERRGRPRQRPPEQPAAAPENAADAPRPERRPQGRRPPERTPETESEPETEQEPEPEPESKPEPEPVKSGPGTVPQLTSPEENYVPLTVVDPLLSGSIAPMTPNDMKVIRYASYVLEKYDSNQSGFLEREEWSQMPGAPQSIDVDGDFIVSLDELVRFIALYGNVRTIHRPNPPSIPARLNWTTERPSSFQPFSAPLKPKAEPEEPKEPDPADTVAEEIDENQIVGENIPGTEAEGTEENAEPTSPAEGEEPNESEEGENEKAEDAEKEEKLDELSYEKVFSDQFKPKERKYYVPLNELRGVPNWFVFRDKNGDGQITMLEFDPNLSPASLAAFGRLDKNKDGFLSPDEVRVK